jgi:glycosyltransferase involved in cell wall biosynthesis
MKILLVSAHDGGPACGVFDHASRLAEQLRLAGESVDLSRPEQLGEVTGYDLIHLHYVPFLYERWGLGALPLARRLKKAAPLVITVHEPRVRYAASPRDLAFAAAQDFLLFALGSTADALIVPTSRWLPFLRGRKAAVIPSGSILPLESAPHSAPRRQVALIASGHPARMHGLAVRACQAVADAHGMAIVAIGQPMADGLQYTGYLPPAEFAACLSESDLLVLPFTDGVSGRRTSFISAVQVGVATITTLTSPMDDFSVDGGFEHTSPRNPDEFVKRAVSLAGDESRLAQLRSGGRELYERELSWDVIGPKVMEVYRSTLR